MLDKSRSFLARLNGWVRGRFAGRDSTQTVTLFVLAAATLAVVESWEAAFFMLTGAILVSLGEIASCLYSIMVTMNDLRGYVKEARAKDRERTGQ